MSFRYKTSVTMQEQSMFQYVGRQRASKTTYKRAMGELDANRKVLNRIDEEEELVLKYNDAYPMHSAAACGDLQAVQFLSKRKHYNSYNEVGQMPLHLAARNGHVRVVALLVRLGADVNVPEKSSGRTSVHSACLGRHTSVLDVLLDQGAVVYERDKNGSYPMHLAAEGGSPHIIQQLIAAGASATCKDKENRGPIHYAALYDQAAAIELLYQHGTNMDETDKLKSSALHIAALNGKLVAITKLVQLAASLNSVDQHGETPLHHATRSSQIEAIRLLAKLGAVMDARNNMKESSLHVASRLDLHQSARQLIRSGAAIYLPHKKGIQSVHIAAAHNSCSVIKVIASEHGDLNATDKNGDRALHHTVVNDSEDAISKLVELGADVNAPGKRGDTSLHVATKLKKVNLIPGLAKLGADCNAENEDCVVPLYYAMVNTDTAAARCLIRCGADVNKLNKEGDGLIHILVEEEHFAALDTLNEVKAKLNLLNQDGASVVHIASRDLNRKCLKALKEAGVDLSSRNKDGLTAVHVAVMNGRAEEVDMLHDVGTDLNQTTQKSPGRDDRVVCKEAWAPGDANLLEQWNIKGGLTAVHLCLLHGKSDILSHLVACGADVNRGNDEGETAFHLAVLYNMVDSIKQLLTLGADRNCKDKKGRTPLHYACHTGSLECLRMLLKYGASITETDHGGRQALHYVAEAGHFLLLPEFTGHGSDVDIDCRDTAGLTPLHFACRSGQMNTIIELVQLNADVQAKDDDGNTVVHAAAANGQHEIIAQLATMGCSMDIRNKEMKTPLHMAGEMAMGDTMELLIMCGCNPNIRDANENLASTFRLPQQQKQAVARRIKQYNDNHSSRHKTGEISFQCATVSAGTSIEFEKLGITVTLESETDVRPIIFLHRTPTDAARLDIPVHGLEDMLSDFYELRVFCLEEACSLLIEVPLDGYPDKFETFFRTTDGDEYHSFTTSEENGIPLFVGKIPICRGTAKRFGVIVRPQCHTHNIGISGGTILSDVDRNVRLEVPKDAFDNDVNVNLQILKTGDMEKSTTPLFAADIVNVMVDSQPRAPVRVRLPLHVHTDDPDEVAVLCIHGDQDIGSDFKWTLVQSHIQITNGCITFTTAHFSIFVTVYLPKRSSLNIDAAKRLAKDRLKTTLQRETSVLFFYAVSPRKANYLTILECTTPGRFQRRKAFWENEGFLFHSQVKHSGYFPAKPNESFYFEITGNLQFVGQASSHLKLTFNPRSYKYQSFYIKQINRTEPLIGEFNVVTSSTDTSREEVLTNIPIELPERKSCVIS